MKIAVLGAGSWGTALANHLALASHEVTLWARRQELTEKIRKTRINDEYLPGIVCPDSLKISSDMEETLFDAELVLTVTPTQTLRETLQKAAPYIQKEAILVSASKGIENNTLKRCDEIIEEVVGQIKRSNIAVLSGPSHAEELGKRMPTTCVVASACEKTALLVQDVFMNGVLRIYTNPDVIGVELGGALKNIIALGAGISDGLGYGDNAKAALMTRGIAEISRLGVKLGADPLTFAGLSGIGDLIVTCTSMHSRNRRAGILLGEGKSKEEVLKSTNMVVEGIKTTYSAYELAQKYDVPMPITTAIYEVLENSKAAKEVAKDLMLRGKKHEVEEVALYNHVSWVKE